MLTTEILGIYNILLSILSVITTIICSGISITISRQVSINHNFGKIQENDKLIFSSLILTSIIGSILSIGILLSKNLLSKTITGDEGYILLICMIPCILSCAIYTPFKSYLMGREMFYQSSLVEFVEQILKIIICVIVFYICKNLEAIYSPVIALSLSAILSTILGIYYYKKANGRLQRNNTNYKFLIQKSTPITLVKLMSTIIMPILTILMPILLVKNGYSNQEALSQLGVATGMTLPLLSIPGTLIGSLALAMLPQITTMYAKKQNATISKHVSKALNFTLIVTSICVPIFIVLGKDMCLIIFNNELAGTLLVKASWIMIPLGISQITTTILNSMGYEKQTFVYYIISGLFLLICILILTKYIGILSFIYALATSNVILSILNIYKIRKVLDQKLYITKNIISLTIITFAVIFLGINIHSLFSKFIPTFINLIISASLLISCFIVLCFCCTLIKYNDVKLIFKKKINKSV